MTNVITFPKNNFESFAEAQAIWNEIEEDYKNLLTKQVIWNKEMISSSITSRHGDTIFERVKAHERMIYISRQKMILFKEFENKKLEPRLKKIEKFLSTVKNTKVDILV